jgi:hypothetical protein
MNTTEEDNARQAAEIDRLNGLLQAAKAEVRALKHDIIKSNERNIILQAEIERLRAPADDAMEAARQIYLDWMKTNALGDRIAQGEESLLAAYAAALTAARESSRQAESQADQWMKWASQIFGNVAWSPTERATRFLEEAVEFAQSIGCERGMMLKIIERVFSRPAGVPAVEIGQCLAMLECAAYVIGVDARKQERDEFARVQALPKEEWERRYAAKKAAGVAQ